jgi:c-di-GMP-binding flagellar brake protein YcgR
MRSIDSGGSPEFSVRPPGLLFSGRMRITMKNTERVTGKTLYQILDNARIQRTTVDFTVIGMNYDRLSVITGLSREGETGSFRIDLPDQFFERVSSPEGRRVYLEFVGSDRISYSIRTTISQVSSNEIWLAIPDSIERKQRRRHFRVEPPLGTMVSFTYHTGQYEASVSNISLGGALIITRGERFLRETGSQVGDTFRDLEILYKKGEEIFRVAVNKAELKRIDKIEHGGRFSFALQFREIDKEEVNRLEQLVYFFQREILKHRSGIEDR